MTILLKFLNVDDEGACMAALEAEKADFGRSFTQEETKTLAKIGQDLGLKVNQVQHVIQLLSEDNTIPFIARYRKELTGGLIR